MVLGRSTILVVVLVVAFVVINLVHFPYIDLVSFRSRLVVVHLVWI